MIIPEFRDSERAINAVSALLSQALPSHAALEIVVVDDGSADDTVDILRSRLPSTVRLVALPENSGRSAARQRGIEVATGELIGFLDCDCEPATVEFLARHIAAIDHGVVASTGPVVGVGNTFWDTYQRTASDRRGRLHARGVQYVGTTTNLLIRATALKKVQGFDLRYTGYGFEDRDLLIRLSRQGLIAWVQDAAVRHLDRMSMVSLSMKMTASGRENARLFATQHPTEYAALGYAAVDVHERGWLRVPAALLSRTIAPLAGIFDIIHRWLPLRLSLAAARGLSAASFLVGTRQTAIENPPRARPGNRTIA